MVFRPYPRVRSQKPGVRIAWPRVWVWLSSVAMAARARASPAPPWLPRLMPSGNRPTSSGCRRMINAIGTMIRRTTPAIVTYPVRHPKLSTTYVIEIGAMMPPRDTPIEPMARAQPRFTTNHLVTVALRTGPP